MQPAAMDVCGRGTVHAKFAVLNLSNVS